MSTASRPSPTEPSCLSDASFAGAGSLGRDAARGRGRGGRAAADLERDEGLVDLQDVADVAVERGHGSRVGARQFHRGLGGLDVDERLVQVRPRRRPGPSRSRSRLRSNLHRRRAAGISLRSTLESHHSIDGVEDPIDRRSVVLFDSRRWIRHVVTAHAQTRRLQ